MTIVSCATTADCPIACSDPLLGRVDLMYCRTFSLLPPAPGRPLSTCWSTLKKHCLSPFLSLSFAIRPWANGACAVFWPDFGAKGGFSRRPGTYLALPKKRAKKRVFRVFFRAVFSSCRGRRCRRAAGEDFCPLATSGPRENAKNHGETTKNGVQTA